MTSHIESNADILPFRYQEARPVVTVTVALFHQFDGVWKTFLGKRKASSKAYPGSHCIPGGKLDARGPSSYGETVEEAGLREIAEETGVPLAVFDLHLVDVSSDPDTDPRGHFVNIFYGVILDPARAAMAKAGDDLAEGDWFTLQTAEEMPLAFDHNELLVQAIEQLSLA